VWTPATAAGHLAKINRKLEEVTGRTTSYTLDADLYQRQHMVTCWCKDQVLGKWHNLERHAARKHMPGPLHSSSSPLVLLQKAASSKLTAVEATRLALTDMHAKGASLNFIGGMRDISSLLARVTWVSRQVATRAIEAGHDEFRASLQEFVRGKRCHMVLDSTRNPSGRGINVTSLILLGGDLPVPIVVEVFHTTDNLNAEAYAAYIRTTIDNWGVRVRYVGSDNTAVMPAAIRLAGLVFAPCLSHILQLLYRRAVEATGVGDAISAIHALLDNTARAQLCRDSDDSILLDFKLTADLLEGVRRLIVASEAEVPSNDMLRDVNRLWGRIREVHRDTELRMAEIVRSMGIKLTPAENKLHYDAYTVATEDMHDVLLKHVSDGEDGTTLDVLRLPGRWDARDIASMPDPASSSYPADLAAAWPGAQLSERAEYRTFHRNLAAGKLVVAEGQQLFDFYRSLPDTYAEVRSIGALMVTIPVSNTQAERSFSTLKNFTIDNRKLAHGAYMSRLLFLSRNAAWRRHFIAAKTRGEMVDFTSLRQTTKGKAAAEHADSSDSDGE